MRLIWAFGVESRQVSVVLPCLQSCFEDLRALTGGSRPPILRLHSDKASEFLSPAIRAYLSQQGVRQTVNSGYDPQGNVAERCIGIVKVRATALLVVLCLSMGGICAHSPSHRNSHKQCLASLWRCGGHTPRV